MKIKTLISSEELQKRIKEIGKQITEEYRNKEIVIICILRGAVYFATDLTNRGSYPIHIILEEAHRYVNNGIHASIKLW